MSKKFRKLLFLSAAVASATAAVCYFVRKKESALDEPEEDDYDDFSDDTEKDSDGSTNYVPLNNDTPEAASADSAEVGNTSEESVPAENAAEETVSAEAAPSEEPSGEKASESASFTPLAEQVAQAAEKAEESVEEFFDEDDSSEEEPPISES